MGSVFTTIGTTVGDVYTSVTNLTDQELLVIEFFIMAWLLYYSLNYGYTSYRQTIVYNGALRRRALRDGKVFNIPTVNEKKAEKILAAKTVEELVQMQIKKEVTSVEIVAVYSKRSHTIGRQLNLVTEEYYEEALKMAAERDRELAMAIGTKQLDKIGRLHGIPVSIKDHVRFLSRKL